MRENSIVFIIRGFKRFPIQPLFCTLGFNRSSINRFCALGDSSDSDSSFLHSGIPSVPDSSFFAPGDSGGSRSIVFYTRRFKRFPTHRFLHPGIQAISDSLFFPSGDSSGFRFIVFLASGGHSPCSDASNSFTLIGVSISFLLYHFVSAHLYMSNNARAPFYMVSVSFWVKLSFRSTYCAYTNRFVDHYKL